MLNVQTSTLSFIRLSDIASAYAKEFHDPGTDLYVDFYENFMEEVASTKFTWGANDFTFVSLSRLIEEFAILEDILDGMIVAPPSAEIYVLLEQ
jgi:hypothetical protein